MSDGGIRTQLDDLILALKSAGKPVGVSELSSACGLSEKDTLKWAHVLEAQGKVRLENRLSGVFVSWSSAHTKHSRSSHEQDSFSENKIFSSANQGFEQELETARQREDFARQEKKIAYEFTGEQSQSGALSGQEQIPASRQEELGRASKQIAEVGQQLEKVESMIAALHAQKKLATALKEKIAQKRKADELRELKIAQKKAAKVDKMRAAKDSAPAAPAEPEGEKIPAIKISLDAPSKPEPISLVENDASSIIQQEPSAEQSSAQEKAQPELQAEEKNHSAELLPEREDELKAAFSAIKPLLQSKKPGKEKIQKPQPLHVSGVSLQFSERLARQVQKILRQNQEIDRLRQEKEKLLTEHYLPMQRKLESEIETISDRVLRMEKNILGMQERASNLPNKVSAVEKLQISSIKAHGQMRRVYDEAAALIEESARELAEEREKMETLVDQSRQEISSHRSKTVELEQTLGQISRLENEASNRVIEARAALAEQAERLASAEKHSQELNILKSEIVEGVSSIKREMGATKAILTGLEKQMEQMRQVEIYSQSIRQDYEQKMGELSNYIKHGNEDFETLRESVEANFVRRYLKELRELTDSYGYEFGQAKKLEGSIDERIYDEKMKLEGLIEEGKRIAHLYELQSKEVQGAESFEQHGEKLAEMEQLAEKRTKIENMIAQVIGGRSSISPKVASAPIKTQGVARRKWQMTRTQAKSGKNSSKQNRKKSASRKKGRR